jgi:RNA polymerase sigma factor (sigma-70 family)
MWRGNEAAFTVAFERHAAGLLGFCRHMVGSPEEAEDAVQHTFVAAFRHLRRRGERRLALKPWLYAIARNRCLSTLRSRRERTALDLDLRTEGLTEQVERRAELRELLRDLLDLPEDQRAALLLTQAGDLSHAEVADVLGCEVANVKALVFRARSGLIQRRDARETACEDIREQLANLRGNSLRRSALRHHLRSCAGCRAYREEVGRQRGLLVAALPVAPSLHLRSSVIAATGAGGGSFGGGLAAGVGTGLFVSLGADAAVKVAVVCLVVGGAAKSGETLIAHAESLLAKPPEVPAGTRASSSPNASPGRAVGERPTEPRDSGFIALDLTNPAIPVFKGRTVYPPNADGDGHSSSFDEHHQLLFTGDEDFCKTSGPDTERASATCASTTTRTSGRRCRSASTAPPTRAARATRARAITRSTTRPEGHRRLHLLVLRRHPGARRA